MPRNMLTNGDRLLTIHQNINQKRHYRLDLVRLLKQWGLFLLQLEVQVEIIMMMQ